MDVFSLLGPPEMWLIAYAIALGGGIVKGVVGFAMPLILISGLSSFLPPELALACVIVPTLTTNAWQALRQGLDEVMGSIRRFRIFLIAGGVCLVASAQLVPLVSAALLLFIIGVPMTVYALATLAGRRLILPDHPKPPLEAAIGGVAGALGGMTGVYGPITVAMLTAMGIEKREHVRVQGVVYGLAALALAAAHWLSGVLNAQTLPLSLALVPPSLLGVWTGFQIQDRIDQALFRRLTLLVLLVAGVNVLRRAVLAL